MRSFIISISCMLLISLSVTCCKRLSEQESVLNEFEIVTALSPVDSTCLDAFDVAMPTGIIAHDNWYIVEKSDSDNAVDIINPETKEKIECFRRGRGPNEVMTTGHIQIYNGDLYLFDITRQILYSLDLEKTIRDKRQSIDDRISIQSNFSENIDGRLFSVYKTENYIITAALFSDGTWYGALDNDGNIKGRVPVENFKSTEALSTLERSSLFISSLFSVRPDGKAGVCSSQCGGLFSIFDVKTDSIQENRRRVFFEPKVSPSNVERMISPRHSPDDVRGFCDVDSDQQYVYLLFSGKELSDFDDPSFLCNHLLVYDWDGNPVRRYELEKAIHSIYLKDGKIYGCSMYPESRIYVYELAGTEYSR